jgi:plastocyanin
MKDLFRIKSKRVAPFAVVALMTGVTAGTLSATEWQAAAGAQSADLGNVALAFLPNELWIHAGDSIRWTFSTEEPHSVSFLKTGQIRPPAFSMFGVNDAVNNASFVGCPGTTPDGSSFDGTSCVSSGPSRTGQSYTINFPTAGNFKLVCLVHPRMTGAIHVLPLSVTLPYDQSFYDRQANSTGRELLADAAALQGRGEAGADQISPHEVTAGIAAILGNGGGSQTTMVMRFLGATTIVRVGDTVEWTNLEPIGVHTITFGQEPVNAIPPSSVFPMDPDGVPHAMISSPTESVNSGFIGVQNQETSGQPEAPLGFLFPSPGNRFRVTFTAPGTFNYICSLHDELGMKGTVIVHQ